MIQGMKRYCRVYQGVKLPWGLLALTLMISFLSVILEVGSVQISASIIDATRNTITTNDFLKYVFYLLGYGVLSVGDVYLGNLAYEKICMGVRTKLWNKIMRIPSKYYDSDNGNELISRVTSDASSASEYFRVLITTITSLYSAIVIFARLFAFETTLAAWTLLIIPCAIGFGALYGSLSFQAAFRGNKTTASTTGYLAERVQNFRMIKALRTQRTEQTKAIGLFRKQFGTDMMSHMCLPVIQLGIQVMSCVSIVIAFVVGGRMVADGTLTVGRLIAFYSLSSMVAVNMMNVYMNIGAFTQASGGMKKISQILDLEEEKTEGKQMALEDQDIRLEHVSFSYGDVSVLRDVSFTIPKGKTTAIIGANGAGKSTIFKLLERMYQPSEGVIRFGDTDIQEYALKEWRRVFALVAQDSPLFSGTVRENILYGVEQEVSEEDVVVAAKCANAYDFIMDTPGGFDAEVGTGGSNFSGGQKQCIAIARALMCDPRYLLLDEATSNLDVNSECRVSDAFSKLMKGRTTFMIAHSYAATREADYIVIMKNGQVEATGTPEELLQTNDYYRMFARTGKELVCPAFD